MEHLITQNIIGAAIEVHRRLGPGLLEATYEMCLAQEFKFQNIPFERQGLILNFNVPALKEGIKRVSNDRRAVSDSNVEFSAASAFSESLR